MPLAVEQFDLSSYDLVISNSHAVAKGVLIGPDQVHLSYVHSPMRYAWDLQHQYLRSPMFKGRLRRWMARALLHYLRLWDVRSSMSPTALAANSGFVARRMLKAYRREATVIYPPVDTERFVPGTAKSEYFLCVSRMFYYKRLDIVVEAFASLPEERLIVIGDGPERAHLERMAGSNVTFLGYQPENVLIEHLQRARALIFAAEEDFGLLPVEAQACGTPVIAYGKGGALETVRGLSRSDTPTGVFFSKQEPADICSAVRTFLANEAVFTPRACRENALSFSAQRFRAAFRQFVDTNLSGAAIGDASSLR
jgi:glycosyltransferase involved in cell wall biosynthesis